MDPIEIDLGFVRKQQVDERYRHRHAHIHITVGKRSVAKFGDDVKHIIRAVFNNKKVAVNIVGTRAEIKSFIDVIKREKQYLKTAKKYGLSDPRTYKFKYKVEKAVAQFERDTGLKWPLRG